MVGRLIERTVTVANGQSLSEEIDIGDAVLVALQVDSGWNDASITFQAKMLDGTLGALKFEGAEVTFTTVKANEYVTISPTKFAGVQKLKVRSGTLASAVNQTGDSVVTLLLRGIN